MEQGKVCVKCGEWKEYINFYKQSGLKDGYRNDCKECIKRYRKENSERINKYNKNYYKNHYEEIKQQRSEKLDYYKNYRKKYRKENAEKIKESNKRYLIENYGTRIKSLKRYSKSKKGIKCRKRYEHSEKGKTSSYRSSVKRRSFKQKVSFQIHERKEILNRDNYTCQYCGIKVHDRSTGNWNTSDKAHIDHIIPISKGGNSEPNNLQILCRTCNLSKSNKTAIL